MEAIPLQCPVFGEHNIDTLTGNVPAGQSRGYKARDYEAYPVGFCSGLSALPSEMMVPRDQWDERIEEMERTKTRLSDLVLAAGLPCKDQNGTNYCWINAPTHAVEVRLIQQNQRKKDGGLIILSPASVGCKIKGFRNVGGWGGEGLEYIREHGLVPVELWPANAISRTYDKPEAWKEAEQFIVLEWFDLKPRSFDEKMSCHFHRIPTADGYNWWSHEVTGYDPIRISASVRDSQRRWFENSELFQKLDPITRDRQLEELGSKYGSRERNSWGMSYGDRGFFDLTESKATPDDSCCPRVVVPS